MRVTGALGHPSKNMHIITGKYKGRIIKAPKGIRPTEDRVRKAFFDIMGDVSGLAFLELFAGSGAMGLEALSLGAEEVVFVENDRNCVRTIESNIHSLMLQVTSSQPQSRVLKPAACSLQPAACSLKPEVSIIPKDVFEVIPMLAKNNRKFDLIFLDPPYYRGLGEKILQIFQDYDILLPSGYIIIQHFKKDSVPEIAGNLVLWRQKKYGDSLLSFYNKKG
jgi:16S rRNA (guanine(966)-N(2))-methyltransferase RsmD